MSGLLARLPKVDHVLASAPLAEHPAASAIKTRAVRDAVATLRARLRAGETISPPDAAALAARVEGTLSAWFAHHPAPVINATGVLLHTNLGRAPLSVEARAAMLAASGYCELELELTSGRRGSRDSWVRPLLRAVLDAEDVLVVNNGAAALLLACTALAAPEGVVLSRGQMVEIGDRFRVADLAAAAGARLWPIGSTNRTHARDYRDVLASDAQPGPAAILWVHLSNFRQDGFIANVELERLAALAREFEVPLIADLGSGSLAGSSSSLAADKITVQDCLALGVDLVTCSGDKLLGGPQAGIMAGRAALIERCRRHPMARALRLDKTAMAALHATIVAHASDPTNLPLQRMANVSIKELRARARELAAAMGWSTNACVRATRATIGGGSLPGDTIESVALVVQKPRARSVDALARRLRLGTPSVVARVHDDELWLDLRTVDPSEMSALQSALQSALCEPLTDPS